MPTAPLSRNLPTERVQTRSARAEHSDSFNIPAVPLEPFRELEVSLLAGLEMGGIAVVTALGIHAGLQCAFVRKTAKSYGTRHRRDTPSRVTDLPGRIGPAAGR